MFVCNILQEGESNSLELGVCAAQFSKRNLLLVDLILLLC